MRDLNKEKERGDRVREELDMYKKLFTRAQHFQSDDHFIFGPGAIQIVEEKNYPLPHPSTLQRSAWIFLEPVLPALAKNAKNDLGKYCVISLDEIKTGRCYEYNAIRKRILRPTDYALVFMVIYRIYRGFFNYPKFPVKRPQFEGPRGVQCI